MSAVISLPLDTKLKARLATWVILLLVVFVSTILLWMSALFFLGLINLMVEGVLGSGAGASTVDLVAGGVGLACALIGAFVYICMVRGTLGEGGRTSRARRVSRGAASIRAGGEPVRA